MKLLKDYFYLTTDGMESERIRSKTIEKEYYVQLDGDITEDKINLLKTGIEISIIRKNIKHYPVKPLIKQRA